MKQPQGVQVLEGRGYITYAEPRGKVGTRDLREDCMVAADIDESGAVIGIEILDVSDAAQVAVAREFATTNGLAFPRDISGTLTTA
jgi:uncharacterized protein YuzE